VKNTTTRKAARKEEILRILTSESQGMSNQDLMATMGLPYAAVRAATSELATEHKIRGQVVGNEKYGFICWKVAEASDGK
jgi:predicted ArsR family transcriptional regulator